MPEGRRQKGTVTDAAEPNVRTVPFSMRGSAEQGAREGARRRSCDQRRAGAGFWTRNGSGSGGYGLKVPSSMAAIMSMRRWWRPPSKAAVSQWRAIILASSVPTTRAPMVRMLLSLWRLLSSAL